MTAQQVASLFGEISLRDNISGPMRNIANQMGNLGRNVRNVGMEVSAVSLPLAGLYAAGISAAAGFEDVMNQLETFGGLAGAELEAVRQTALQLGADTMFSASDAANAMLELVKAGQDVSVAMQNAEHAMSLAAVGGMGMEEAAGILATTINNFNLDPIDEARWAVDTLAKAANISTADVNEMAQALANVGGVPAQFGLSLDQTAAALAIFHDSGVRGAEAGTQLRSMLLNMTRPTEEVRNAWNRLGTSAYDNEGNLRNWEDIIDDINIGLAGMSEQEANETLVALAGSYGVVGLTALLAAGGMDTALAAMEEAPDAATLAAGAMNTFNGRVEGLKGSLETLAINVMTPFMENTLKPFVEQVTNTVNAVNDWVLANPELAGTLTGIGAIVLIVGPALAGLGLIMQGLGVVVGLATAGIHGLRAGLTLLLGPVGVVIVAAGVLYAAYETNFLGIRDLIDNEVIPAFNRWRDAVNNLPLVNQVVNPGASGVLGALVESQREQLQAQADAQRGQPPPQLNISGSNFESPFIPGRASGGNVSAGGLYMVGERGPELFAPGRSGAIIPNDAIGGQTVNVYLTAYGSNPHELLEMVRRAARERA